MVLDAFTNFSPDVAEITQTMFTNGHVDWLPRKNKQGGAYCAYGDKDYYPYVLLNYTEDLRDVMTVAHELGHAVHDVLASQHNNHFQAHASLALAEVASTFGEALIFDKLMQSDLPKEDRIALLMSTIEDNFATIHRQATMYQFEQQLHERRKSEGELSKEQINDLWHETMQRPFTESLVYTDEHKNTWMYVSHIFRSPFYVYSYAFAQLCTLALYQLYKEKGSEFVPTYVQILKTGGSLSPKDNLAQAGLDITKPEFWQNGLAVVKGYIDELEKLTAS